MEKIDFDLTVGEYGAEHAERVQAFLSTVAEGTNTSDAYWILPIIADALALGYAIGQEDGWNGHDQGLLLESMATPFIHARES
jgi:hypothetical protein